jgi:hypothetical protein
MKCKILATPGLLYEYKYITREIKTSLARKFECGKAFDHTNSGTVAHLPRIIDALQNLIMP